jgi:hypothetical protein
MLYDPKWEKPEVKADPFSLESLIAWLEKQPSDGSYDWYGIEKCLVCQFYQANGISEPWGECSYTKPFDRGHGHADAHRRYWAVGQAWPWTFGAALERARALR